MATPAHPSSVTTPAPAPRAESAQSTRLATLATYMLAGSVFGIIIVKTEIVSWYRIQEMFRFQSFHMYGVLGSAMLTAFVSVQLLTRLRISTLAGEPVSIPLKEFGRGYRYWIGGGLFGIGWALTGACPGPLFALIGSGVTVFVIVAASALAGTWTYGYLRPRLPH